MPPPPTALAVAYHAPDDAAVPALMRAAGALVIPAVGAKLAPALFEGSALKLVQVTGAGLDRLDQPALTRLGIPVANVPGGSNSAVAEYAVTAASVLLRRFAWADAEIADGQLRGVPRPHGGATIWPGSKACWSAWSGFGTIGVAVAQAFHPHGLPHLLSRSGDRRYAVAAQALGATAVPLDELLRTADVRQPARAARCRRPRGTDRRPRACRA